MPIADYLKKKGQDNSYSARKKLALSYGISDYRGTADQNTKLLTFLQKGKAQGVPVSNPTDPVANSLKDFRFMGPEKGRCKGTGCSEIATDLFNEATGKNKFDYIPTQDSWYLRSAVKKNNGKLVYDPAQGKEIHSSDLPNNLPENFMDNLQNFDLVSMERGVRHSGAKSKVPGYSLADNDGADHTGTIVRDKNGKFKIYHGYDHEYQLSDINPDGTVSLTAGVPGRLNYKIKGVYRAPKVEKYSEKPIQLQNPNDIKIDDRYRIDRSKAKNLNDWEKSYLSLLKDDDIKQLAAFSGNKPEDVFNAYRYGMGVLNNESGTHGPAYLGMKRIAKNLVNTTRTNGLFNTQNDSPSTGAFQMKGEDLFTDKRKSDLFNSLGIKSWDFDSTKENLDKKNVMGFIANYLVNRNRLKDNPDNKYDEQFDALDGHIPLDYAAIYTHKAPSSNINRPGFKDLLETADKDYVNNVLGYLNEKGLGNERMTDYYNSVNPGKKKEVSDYFTSQKIMDIPIMEAIQNEKPLQPVTPVVKPAPEKPNDQFMQMFNKLKKQATGGETEPKSSLFNNDMDNVAMYKFGKPYGQLSQLQKLTIGSNRTHPDNYQPSKGVNYLKKALAAGSLATSNFPAVSYLFDAAGATGDAYTSLMHNLNDDNESFKEDATQSLIGFLPMPKPFKNIGGYTLPKGAKTLKRLKNIVDTNELNPFATGGEPMWNYPAFHTQADKAMNSYMTDDRAGRFAMPGERSIDFTSPGSVTMNNINGKPQSKREIDPTAAMYTVGAMSMLGQGLESKGYNDYQKWIRQRGMTDNSNPVMAASRGDYSVNNGFFRPDQMTPTQFGAQPTFAEGGSPIPSGFQSSMLGLPEIAMAPMDSGRSFNLDQMAARDLSMESQYQETSAPHQSPGVNYANVEGEKNVNTGKNAEYAFNYFKSKGLQEHVAAGIVGNLVQESGVKPNITNSIGAFGIAQWLGGRKKGLFKFAEQQGLDPRALDTQLEYLLNEPGETKKALAALNKTTTVKDAAVTFANVYERMGQHEANFPRRIGAAQKLAGRYAYGGEYTVSPSELSEILAAGGEVEFV